MDSTVPMMVKVFPVWIMLFQNGVLMERWYLVVNGHLDHSSIIPNKTVINVENQIPMQVCRVGVCSLRRKIRVNNLHRASEEEKKHRVPHIGKTQIRTLRSTVLDGTRPPFAISIIHHLQNYL